MGRQDSTAAAILAEISRDREERRRRAVNDATNLIAAEMSRQGVSLLQMSALSGNSPTTVLRMKKNCNIKVATLADLAGALGYRLKFTLEKEEDDTGN